MPKTSAEPSARLRRRSSRKPPSWMQDLCVLIVLCSGLTSILAAQALEGKAKEERKAKREAEAEKKKLKEAAAAAAAAAEVAATGEGSAAEEAAKAAEDAAAAARSVLGVQLACSQTH